MLGRENSRCISWVWVCHQIRAEDVFHVRTTCLHLLLYTSGQQGVATWSHRLDSCVKLAEGSVKTPLVTGAKAQRYRLPCHTCCVGLAGWTAKVILIPMLCLPGSCCFPQLVSTWNIQGSALLALQKSDSLKHVETKTHREGSTETVKIPALWHWKWCWHACINVRNSYKEIGRSVIQVK